jgi:excisionase family DNA binding protein
MPPQKPVLSTADLEKMFGPESSFPPILSPMQLAALIGISVKTVYEWIARGRLDGAFRKRGKHNLIYRDKALRLLFDGPDWQ